MTEKHDAQIIPQTVCVFSSSVKVEILLIIFKKRDQKGKKN